MLRKSVQSTGVQLIGKVITTLISLVTIRLLTGKLGVTGYGNFTLMTSVFLLFDAMADLGTRVIGVREMAQAKNEEEVKKIWVHIFWLRIMLVRVVFLVGLGFTWWYPGFALIRGEALVVLLMLWGTMVAGSLEVIWQYRLKLEVKTIVDVLFPCLFLGWLVGGFQVDLLTVVTVYLVARWLSLLVGVATVYGFLKNVVWKLDKTLLKRLLIESWPMGLYLLLFTGYDKAIDSLLIQHYWGVAQVAWYGLAYKIYSNLIMPAYFFMASVFPLLSKHEEQREVYNKSRFILLAMILAGAPLIYFGAPLAVQVLSRNEYLASIGILRILIVALFFSYLNHLNGFWLISRGKQRFMLKLGLVVILVNILGNVLFIPRFGMVAGAWMTVVSELTMWLLTTWKIRY